MFRPSVSGPSSGLSLVCGTKERPDDGPDVEGRGMLSCFN